MSRSYIKRRYRETLNRVEEEVRQKVVHILRVTPDKEQAARMIASMIHRIVPIEIKPVTDAFTEEIRKLHIKQKVWIEQMNEINNIAEEPEEGEEWKA